MNFKRFGRTAQMFDASTAVIGKRVNASGTETNADMAYSDYIDVQGISKLAVSHKPAITNFYFYEEKTPAASSYVNGYTADVPVNAKYCRINLSVGDVSVTMLNAGDTALPYQPYKDWNNIPHYIMGTSTDTITTPAVLYPNDTTAIVGLKGQMEQGDTPTPTTPIQPSEFGDLETTGEHTGQYKIPIISGNTTTPVYLGEVETTRKIKKLVLTGEEEIVARESDVTGYTVMRITIEDYLRQSENVPISTHYVGEAPITSIQYITINNTAAFLLSSSGANYLYIYDDRFTTASSFKTFLAGKYAAGTPVTIWYVLATPTTGIVNEPLRKIGDYADEVSGITIPVTAGANTLSVDTTLQPSEITANYHGWHPVQSVHERENGAWD